MYIDVAPRFSAYRLDDGGMPDAELMSKSHQGSPLGAESSDLPHIVVGELPSPVSSLDGTVMVVVARCSKKQMGRINARRDITVMADKQAVRDRTIRQLPRESMSGYGRLAYFEGAIAVTGYPGRPEPACLGLVDVFPECLNRLGTTSARIGARPRAAAGIRSSRERRAALGALTSATMREHRGLASVDVTPPAAPSSAGVLDVQIITEAVR